MTYLLAYWWTEIVYTVTTLWHQATHKHTVFLSPNRTVELIMCHWRHPWAKPNMFYRMVGSEEWTTVDTDEAFEIVRREGKPGN